MKTLISGDKGWDVFSLDYKMAGPIGTVFNQDVMIKYLMIFNALWRAKRVEWMLSCVWKRQAGTGLIFYRENSFAKKDFFQVSTRCARQCQS